MLGYILAAIIGLALVVLALAALGGTQGGPPDKKRGRPRNGLQSDQPAADEPTPDWSVTATPPEVDAARRHTPPA